MMQQKPMAGRLWFVVSIGLAMIAPSLQLTADEPTAEQLEFFEAKVRPILVEHCYECHSAEEGTTEAGLSLDSRAGWQTGGDSGTAIVPGKPDQSLLIEAIGYEEDVVSGMPPRSKLADEKIATLKRWIEMGAPDPRIAATTNTNREVFDLEARQQSHWSWRPVQPTALPEVAMKDWPLGEIDRFILAKMEAGDLLPAEDADKAIWLRRVYFDLIGLPPTPQQLDFFLADDSDGAHESVVDQLLDSPHFGEKWARHWMDLVRYADTYGHEFDYPIQHAYEYRDYLIRALNADVPYDQFVREQIAGDLIETPRRHPKQHFNESILGTAYWYLHEATHSPTDVLGNEADIIDNQLDVFGKTFLGLTVACARCHDHKFDAISTADYYALSAYLQSSCRQEILIDSNRRFENASAQVQQLRSEATESLIGAIASSPEEIARLTDKASKYYQAAVALLREHSRPKNWTQIDPATVSREAIVVKAGEQSLHADKLTQWVEHAAEIAIQRTQEVSQSSLANTPGSDVAVFADFSAGSLPLGWTTSDFAFESVGDQATLASTGLLAFPGTVHSGLAGGKQVGILRSPTFELTTDQIHLRMRASANMSVRLVIDNYQMATFNGLLFRGTFLNGKATDTEGRWQWKSLAGDVHKYKGHRAYLEFVDHNAGSIEVDKIIFSDRPVSESLVSGGPSSVRRSDSEADGKALKQSLQTAWKSIAAGKGSRLLASLMEADLIQLDQIDASAAKLLQQADRHVNDLPQPRFAIAMAQGSPEDAAIYIRGSHTNLGESVPPRFLEALGGTEGSRLTLAEQVASEDNPLTARVMVNRIWHHLFGRGIVATVDDFGPQGQPPSHPQLLDWLAENFVQQGWSVKEMVKQMVLSRTYRQSSVANPALPVHHLETTDPENKLLYHMPVRRLPAESIRDAILLVSGRLDRKMYGPAVATHRTRFMTGRGARPSGPLDGDGRRSIYLSVYRNFLNPFMLTFDTPNPFGPQGRRSQSNVPAQALTLMNDPLVVKQADRWAGKVLSRTDLNDRQRIALMVKQAHSVDPSSEQVDRLRQFMEQQAAVYGNSNRPDRYDQQVWSDLGHALINMKAFYFLR